MSAFTVLYSKVQVLGNKGPAVVDTWFDTVCTIEASSLEAVFAHMNMAGPSNYKVRSMMVGDVVIADDGAWRCEPAGWQQVEILCFAEMFPKTA